MIKYFIFIAIFIPIVFTSCATSEEELFNDSDISINNPVDYDTNGAPDSSVNPTENENNDIDISDINDENDIIDDTDAGDLPETDYDISTENDSESDNDIETNENETTDETEIPDEDTTSNVYVENEPDDDSPVCEDGCSEVAAICLPAIPSEAAEELCDGLDNDCDGIVDEGCKCMAGQTQACFMGPPNFMAVGACKNGVQTCQVIGEMTGVWGECVGGISPSKEICDNLDNDCDGCVDDKLCCLPPINCGYDIGTALPFVDKVIDGTQIYSGGDAANWEWTLSKGPCDIVLNTTSFKMNGTATTTVSGPNLSQLTLNFQLSGSYTLKLKVTSPTHGDLECSWIIKVVSQGLRVELCWDTTGSVDVDLHLGKTGTTADWFSTTTSKEDCYYSNCKASSSGINWGYADVNGNNNPRLDIDNISDVGKPENINLDNPNNGDAFKVFVHYFKNTTKTTYPVINIYCGGTLKATYGVQPQVTGFDNGEGEKDEGDGWKVVDIIWNGDYYSDACELTPRFENGAYVVETGPFSFD